MIAGGGHLISPVDVRDVIGVGKDDLHEVTALVMLHPPPTLIHRCGGCHRVANHAHRVVALASPRRGHLVVVLLLLVAGLLEPAETSKDGGQVLVMVVMGFVGLDQHKLVLMMTMMVLAVVAHRKVAALFSGDGGSVWGVGRKELVERIDGELAASG